MVEAYARLPGRARVLPLVNSTPIQPGGCGQAPGREGQANRFAEVEGNRDARVRRTFGAPGRPRPPPQPTRRQKIRYAIPLPGKATLYEQLIHALRELPSLHSQTADCPTHALRTQDDGVMARSRRIKKVIELTSYPMVIVNTRLVVSS